MRLSAACLLCLGLLSACFDEPRLKADTEANFTASFATMTKDMSSAEKEKLDAALKDIALVQVGLYRVTLDAEASKTLYQPTSTALAPITDVGQRIQVSIWLSVYELPDIV
jgi:hypothetical protein